MIIGAFSSNVCSQQWCSTDPRPASLIGAHRRAAQSLCQSMSTGPLCQTVSHVAFLYWMESQYALICSHTRGGPTSTFSKIATESSRSGERMVELRFPIACGLTSPISSDSLIDRQGPVFKSWCLTKVMLHDVSLVNIDK